uniref:Uncharacterized protein n=1 Tax=Rhizophora mucronata TaxID=61149 RepID=A0A2P2N1K1_RHIMU
MAIVLVDCRAYNYSLPVPVHERQAKF